MHPCTLRLRTMQTMPSISAAILKGSATAHRKIPKRGTQHKGNKTCPRIKHIQPIFRGAFIWVDPRGLIFGWLIHVLISERRRISFRASYLSVASRQVKRITKTIREFNPLIFLFAGIDVNSFSKLSPVLANSYLVAYGKPRSGQRNPYTWSRRTAVNNENNGSLI